MAPCHEKAIIPFFWPSTCFLEFFYDLLCFKDPAFFDAGPYKLCCMKLYTSRVKDIETFQREKKKEKILHTSFFSSFSRRASSSSRHKCSLLLSRLSLSLSCSSCHLLLRKKDLFCLKHQDRLTWRDNSTILSSSLSPICFRLLLVFIEGSLNC